MLFVFPNLNVYSSLGAYTSSSQGLRANEFYKMHPNVSEKPIWPALLAFAAVAAVGYFETQRSGTATQVATAIQQTAKAGQSIGAFNSLNNGDGFDNSYYSRIGFSSNESTLRDGGNYSSGDFSQFDN